MTELRHRGLFFLFAFYSPFSPGEVQHSTLSPLKETVVQNTRLVQNTNGANETSDTYSDKKFDKYFEFVTIQPGHFLMGSDPTKYPYNKYQDKDETQHWVEITKPYQIGRFEVTWGLYNKVLELPSRDWHPENEPVSGYEWSFIKKKFLSKLNKKRKEKGDPCEYRLPTEAEWEFAARGNTTTNYYFGDDEKELVNYGVFYGGKKAKMHLVYRSIYFGAAPVTEYRTREHPVDDEKLKPVQKGIRGMYGNIGEWCEDVYKADLGKDYQIDPLITSTGKQVKEADLKHVVRGGDYLTHWSELRSAARMGWDSKFGAKRIGFRLVRDCNPKR